ncbi:SDR family oxidoreductase [Pseudoroseomonas globiformis]|uniref:SDR family oxidoreductase n=1 Tax=Teichococcus globiformis TaxID=2307229 RepID=A0ABV7G379_9PROT
MLTAVIGASGRSGSALCRALASEEHAFRPVIRRPEAWRALGLPSTSPMLADLSDVPALRAALAGADKVVSCAHARWTPAILEAAPQNATLILMGSTRRYSQWPDEHGDGVRAGEAAFLGGDRPGVMLHPTMIYGAEGENNVQRLAALMRRLPVAPLPGGGHALVQPIYQADVTACLMAALKRPWTGQHVLIVAGPQALPYRSFMAEVARHAGVRMPPVMKVPIAALLAAASLMKMLPGLPKVGVDELRRLTEDKAFAVEDMEKCLGIRGCSLSEGLRRTFVDNAA